ncbi:hypothetical protein BDZ45DRAFT_749667 [Acephala macrosclerotiorum]|nr:hypothetical protein BDZ45DRAFT_749667 [Acephala macrosclerotiorum]
MPRPSDTAKGNQAVGGLVYRGQLGPDVDCQIGLFMMEVEEEKAVVIDSLAETQLVIPETARGVFSRLSKDSREGWALMQCDYVVQLRIVFPLEYDFRIFLCRFGCELSVWFTTTGGDPARKEISREKCRLEDAGKKEGLFLIYGTLRHVADQKFPSSLDQQACRLLNANALNPPLYCPSLTPDLSFPPFLTPVPY